GLDGETTVILRRTVRGTVLPNLHVLGSLKASARDPRSGEVALGLGGHEIGLVGPTGPVRWVPVSLPADHLVPIPRGWAVGDGKHWVALDLTRRTESPLDWPGVPAQVDYGIAVFEGPGARVAWVRDGQLAPPLRCDVLDGGCDLRVAAGGCALF